MSAERGFGCGFCASPLIKKKKKNRLFPMYYSLNQSDDHPQQHLRPPPGTRKQEE